MNRRLFTIINAGIALIAVGAVVFDVTRSRTGGSSHGRLRTTAQSNSSSNSPEAQAGLPVHIESPDDLANARVDDLGSVPSVELTELLRRATPEQRAALAAKFNDAPTDARTFGGMAVFFQAWAQLDPKAALSGAFGIGDVAMRKLAANTVVNSISPYAAPELVNFLRDHPDKDLADECENQFLATLMSSWSLLDPEAASRFMGGLGDNIGYELRYKARNDIAYNWGTLDPAAALEWSAKQAEDSKDSSNLYDEVIRGWCRKNIDEAAAYVAQHLDESMADAAASSVVIEMFDHNNIDGATAWARQLPAGDARDSAESRIASMWASKDPSATAQWAATLSPDEQANLARTIMNNWRDTNWEDASRWLATLTGDARDEALSSAASRDGGTEVDSLTLALSIGKEEMRNDAVENIIRFWAANNAKAAEAWVSGSPLSSEQRDHLRSLIAEVQKDQEGGSAEVERVITTGR